MKKVLLLLAVGLVGFTSCSKDEAGDELIAVKEVVQPNLKVTGAWAANVEQTAIGQEIGLSHYGFDFGQGTTYIGQEVDGYGLFQGGTCATYDGVFNVTKLTPVSLTMAGDGTNFITLTLINGKTLNINAVIYGEVITGTLGALSAGIVVCN